MSYDLLIHNGTIITMDPGFDVLDKGFVGVSNGVIKEVTPQKDDAPLPEARESIDARGGIIMPGLVNTHTHAPMSLFRGLADDLPLMKWLNEYIFPAESRFINPESVFAASLLSCAEMILSGTTCLCDGYFFEDKVAEAVHKIGMRGVLGQGVIDFPAPGVPDPKKNIDAAERFMTNWTGVSPLITPGLFCHSPYTCSEQTLKAAKSLANKKRGLFQIHAAETRAELAEIQKRYQSTPIQYLDRIGIIDDHTLLVHAIYLNETDMERIQNHGAKISVTTESEMKLASGVARIPELIERGITVGLGTDGCASNNDLDLFQEMGMTAKLQKVQTGDPTVMDARAVVAMATIEGAEAIGLGSLIGSIEVGKRADMIVIDTRKPHLTPMYHPYSHLVYAASGSDVNDVIIDGKIVMKDRELKTIDVQEVMATVNRLGAMVAAG
ncbi:MAG: amidohydrolase [Deltaproteobacteria bacterium]|nr:amidohydrolase [Deltaproteobacteria bacterium]